MPNASIGGLGSGLDTATIISQLMQLEAIPQSKLKTRVSTEETTLKALQALNTKLASLATKATDVGKADAWSTLTSTSSLAGVTATASTSASATSFSVKVNAVARSSGETYTDTAALTDVLVPADVDGKRMLTVTHGDRTVTVDTGDGTLRGIVDGLNSTAVPSGVKATMLQVSDGAYRLIVDSTATGTDSGFTITSASGPLLGGPDATRHRAGTNAQIEVSGFTLDSQTNTFAELMPGVSVTLAASTEVGKTAEIAISRDATTQVAAVKSFIDGINALLTEIDTGSGYNAATKTGGVLNGESAVRTVRNALSSAVYPADGSSMAALGLQVDRNGKLVLDEAKFTAAYQADPAKVAAAFGDTGDGFAARVKTVAEAVSDKYTGTLTSAIQGRTDGISRLNASIESWDARLEMRRTTLTRQFTALDVALGKMNSQSSWLSGQIGSLPGYES